MPSTPTTIHVILDGNVQGPFSHSQVLEMVRQGQLLPDTPAWKEGLADWKRLDQLIVWPAAPVANPQPVAVPASAPSPKPDAPPSWLTENDKISFKAFKVRLFCKDAAFESYREHDLRAMYEDGHPLSIRADIDQATTPVHLLTDEQEQERLAIALAHDHSFSADHAHRRRVELALGMMLDAENPNRPREQILFPAFKLRLKCHDGKREERPERELMEMYLKRHQFSLRSAKDPVSIPGKELTDDESYERLFLALAEDYSKTTDPALQGRIELMTGILTSERKKKREQDAAKAAGGCVPLLVSGVLVGGALCWALITLL